MFDLASGTSRRGRASHLEDEALQYLRTSTNAEGIFLVCSYILFQDSKTPLSILYSRTDIYDLDLGKARDILVTIDAQCDSCAWDWRWSSPSLSKLSFKALLREARGLDSRAMGTFFQGINHVRRVHTRRFNELHVKKEYEAIDKELKSPLAHWIPSTNLRHSGASLVTSDAMASLLNPIRDLLEDQKLSLMTVLQRLRVLEVLYQDILDGKDPTWEGLCEEDFSFLHDLITHTPRKLAELLTEKDLSEFQNLCPNDFIRPAELRSKFPVWSRLVHTVRVCAKAYPELVCRLHEATKILLKHGNFFSGMALIYGLFEADHPPTEPWWNLLTVKNICLAYEANRRWQGLPRSIRDNDGDTKIRGETKGGRSCVSMLSSIASMRFTSPLSMRQNMTEDPYASDGPSETNREPERSTGESWSARFTTVGSEVGPEQKGRRSVANENTAALYPLCAGSEIPSQNVNNLSQADAQPEAVGSPEIHIDSDSDSAIGLARTDSIATLSSEVCRPVVKYGREFHGYHGGEYLLPNDKQEQDRLDFQHKLFLLTFGGRLHLAILHNVHRVLDVGTGTGIWAIDFADKYPETEVLGVDLSPIQPSWVPPNCEFQIFDVSSSWNFTFKFDFIHCRMLFCAFSNPCYIYKQAFDALTDGGTIEIQDILFDLKSWNDSMNETAIAKWHRLIKEAYGSRGIDLDCASRYRYFLEAVGFKDIQQTQFNWPLGTRQETQHLSMISSCSLANLTDMLFAISIVPLTEHGPRPMSVEAVEELLVEVQKDLDDPCIQTSFQVVVVRGRKSKPNIFVDLEE